MKKKWIAIIICCWSATLFAQKFTVFSTSVNSEYAEFGVTYTNNNNVLFASSKKNEKDVAFKKDRRRNNSQLHLELYSGFVDERGDIHQTKQFTNEKNNKYFESDITFSPDLKTVYFTWNNFYNTQKRIDSAKWQTLRIVKATFNTDFELVQTEELPFNSEEYSVRSPELTKDGKTLYFASDMPGGYGDFDIYSVDILDNGSFSKPKNLGSKVNSKKTELFPYMGMNNVLYYTSNGHKGKGKFDIFSSKLIENEFQEPINLPAPVNSKYDDFAFVMNSHHSSGYFSSTREGGLGDADIYGFHVNSNTTVCNKNISGEILNANTNDPISNAKITVLVDTKMIDSQIVSFGDTYLFDLECDAPYVLLVERFGYETQELQLDSSDIKGDSLNLNIELVPEVCHQHLSIHVIDKYNQNPLANTEIQLSKNNQLTDTFKTDEKGVLSVTLDCSSKYKLNVGIEDYRSIIEIVETTAKQNDSIFRNIELSYSKDFVYANNRKLIKHSGIDFELDQFYITEMAAKELNRIVEILQKFPQMRILIEAHTDSRAPDQYNLELSNNRATATKDFLITKGINPQRITNKGFGETVLLNNCANGIKCSDIEHKRNRRIEIVVTYE